MSKPELTITKPIDFKVIDLPHGATISFDFERTLFVDIDQTLVMVDYPAEFEKDAIDFTKFGFPLKIVPHKEHIKIIKKFRARGIGVFLWSAGGQRWARAVMEALDLVGWVCGSLGKPDWYIDDKECSEFMKGKRFFLDPQTGKELDLETKSGRKG